MNKYDLFAQPLIVVDTETTGFHHSAEVIEIGAVALSKRGEITSTFSALIRPDILDDWRGAKALEISGLTKEQLLNAPSPIEVQSAFSLWIKSFARLSANASPLVLAYNAPFDKKMLERMGVFCERSGAIWGECLLKMTSALLIFQCF